MLNAPYTPITHRFTAQHDWRMPEAGLVFKVGSYSYRLDAILPEQRHWGTPYRPAQAVLRNLARNTTFVMRLNVFWAKLDGSWGITYPTDQERALRSRMRHHRRLARQARSMARVQERVHRSLLALEAILRPVLAS